MSQYTFQKGYSHTDSMRASLFRLFKEVFNIPSDVLEDFYQKGFWDNTYTPYSFFYENEVVANVSLFEMPIKLNNTFVLAAGIQSVMTHPLHRGKGLMNSLLDKMLEDNNRKYPFMVLLTKQPSLYAKHGFQVVKEYTFARKVPTIITKKPTTIRKLHFDNVDDIQIIRRLFENREPISNVFGFLNHEPTFLLKMYSPFYNQKLYFMEDLDVIVVFEIEGHQLKLYDIVGKYLPSIEELCERIESDVTDIEVYFSPDRFGEGWTSQSYESDMFMMCRGDFSTENVQIKMPKTAEF